MAANIPIATVTSAMVLAHWPLARECTKKSTSPQTHSTVNDSHAQAVRISWPPTFSPFSSGPAQSFFFLYNEAVRLVHVIIPYLFAFRYENNYHSNIVYLNIIERVVSNLITTILESRRKLLYWSAHRLSFSSVSRVVLYDRGSFPSMGRKFLFTTMSRLVPGRTQPPIQWVGLLVTKARVWSWPLTSIQVRSTNIQNLWMYTSTPTYIFIVWFLSKLRDNFTNG
jgi:hypothetical protein